MPYSLTKAEEVKPLSRPTRTLVAIGRFFTQLENMVFDSNKSRTLNQNRRLGGRAVGVAMLGTTFAGGYAAFIGSAEGHTPEPTPSSAIIQCGDIGEITNIPAGYGFDDAAHASNVGDAFIESTSDAINQLNNGVQPQVQGTMKVLVDCEGKLSPMPEEDIAIIAGKSVFYAEPVELQDGSTIPAVVITKMFGVTNG